jgi:hypothetical protein
MDLTLPWRRWHRPLMVNATLMMGLILVAAAGLVLDDRLLLGESVWVKPLKFGLAFTLYSGVLAWLLTKLRKAKRLGWWAGTVFAVAATVEVGAITMQAARGTFSHFNANLTDPVNVVATQIFTYGVAGLFLTQLVIVVLVMAQRPGDRALTRAIRAGLALSTVGMVLPVYWMATSIHKRVVVDADGRRVTLYQGHGIGDPDGHGMPITHWSVTGGDFRVPHFIGLHAIHILLLTAGVLSVAANRRPWLTNPVRANLVGIVAVAYAGLLAVLAWQAGRGQSLIHPDSLTLGALAAVVIPTAATATTLVLVARRQPDAAAAAAGSSTPSRVR